jgi:hypothetical protein
MAMYLHLIEWRRLSLHVAHSYTLLQLRRLSLCVCQPRVKGS